MPSRQRISTTLSPGVDEHTFRAMFENSAVPLFVSTEERILFANRALSEMAGHPDPESLEGRSIYVLFAPAVRDFVSQRRLNRVKGWPEPSLYETRGALANGLEFDMEIRTSNFVLGGQDYALSVLRNITEDKAERERSRCNVERLRLTQQAAHVGSWDWNLATGELTWSDELYRLLGFEPGMRRPSLELWLENLHVEDGARVRAGLEDALDGNNEHYESEYRVRMPDGSSRWLLAKGSIFQSDPREPTRLLGVVIETTERKRLEEQFLQVQKMEAIGRLAGGVAHDFNNLMTIVSGYSSMIRAHVKHDPALDHFVSEIQHAAVRAASLTGQLLAFSRRQVVQVKVLDINQAVNDVLSLLQRVMGEDIGLELALSDAAGQVLCDKGQLDQVLLNLAVNARDAMPKGGHLKIATQSTVVSSQEALANDIQPGRYVELSLSDNGPGIEQSIQEKIFEPFFTTKETGKGTGLGLSTVYGIARQAGGTVLLRSRPGSGSCFSVLLPAATGVSEPPVDSEPGLTARVFLVEDEASLRKMMREILKNAGFSVTSASSGEQALQMLQDRAQEFDVLVTDVVLPGMSGPELVQRLVQRLEGLCRVLYISGYTDHQLLDRNLEAGSGFLQKPFAPAELTGAIRELLTIVERPSAGMALPR
jgi:two-component system cell cycle sensor histidine kinase/response regulator CckA